MPTLAEQRRAIREQNEKARRGAGEAMAKARRDSGDAMSKARRALGDEMIKRRTGKTEVEEINALVNQPRQRRSLPALQPRGGVSAQVGTGNYTAPAATGAGLASPVTEPNYALREYWTNGLVSSDGLFFLPAVKKVVMEDANGAEAVFEYAQPMVPSP